MEQIVPLIHLLFTVTFIFQSQDKGYILCTQTHTQSLSLRCGKSSSLAKEYFYLEFKEAKDKKYLFFWNK